MDHAWQPRRRRRTGDRLRAGAGRGRNRGLIGAPRREDADRAALLPQVCQEVGISAHHVLHVYKGEALAGIVCAHPLRGHGYEQDTPLLLADFVTTDAGTGFVHIAPGHGEDDFILGRLNALEVPETVGGDGTFNAWVPLFAGRHVYKVADAVCAALTDAGALLGRGKIVHSYPHSWR